MSSSGLTFFGPLDSSTIDANTSFKIAIFKLKFSEFKALINDLNV